MDREEIICHCMEISRGKIMDAIESNQLKTVEEVGEATEAGTYCGSCQDDIEEILNEING